MKKNNAKILITAMLLTFCSCNIAQAQNAEKAVNSSIENIHIGMPGPPPLIIVDGKQLVDAEGNPVKPEDFVRGREITNIRVDKGETDPRILDNYKKQCGMDFSGIVEVTTSEKAPGDTAKATPPVYMTPQTPKQPDERNIWSDPERMPQFSATYEQVKAYFEKNSRLPLNYDRKNKKRVIVSFKIEKYGKMTGFKVARSIGSKYDKEALRLVKSLKKLGTWKPGQMNGKPMAVKYNIAVPFRVE